MDDTPVLPDRSSVSRVHRVGAVVMGLVLWLFGGLGLVSQLGFFETTGAPVLGLNSNGLLSLVSLVVGAVLIGAGLRGGRTASTVTAVIGGLFLLSGLANLVVLDSDLNLLAFEIANVYFSFVAGILLLTLGLYGRVSGGLPADNPYRRERARKLGVLDDTPEDEEHDRARITEIDMFVQAEQLVAEGRATPEQEQMVAEDRQRRATHEHARAWERAAANAPEGTASSGNTP